MVVPNVFFYSPMNSGSFIDLEIFSANIISVKEWIFSCQQM